MQGTALGTALGMGQGGRGTRPLLTTQGEKKSGTSCSSAQWGLVSPLNTEEGLVTPPQQVTLGYV